MSIIPKISEVVVAIENKEENEIFNPEKFWGKELKENTASERLIEINFSESDIESLLKAYSTQDLEIIANEYDITVFDVVSTINLIKDSQYYRIGFIGRDLIFFSIDWSGEVLISVGGSISRKQRKNGYRVIRLCIKWWKEFLKISVLENEIYCRIYDDDGFGYRRKFLFQRLGFIRERGSRRYVYR